MDRTIKIWDVATHEKTATLTSAPIEAGGAQWSEHSEATQANRPRSERTAVIMAQSKEEKSSAADIDIRLSPLVRCRE